MDRGEWEEGDSAGAGVGEEVLGAGGVGIKKRIGDGGRRGPGGTTWSCGVMGWPAIWMKSSGWFGIRR